MPALLTAVLLVLSGTPAPEAAVAVPRSDAPVALAAPGAISGLRHSWLVDGSITGVTVGLWLVSDTVLKDQFVPAQCRLWCETTVNPIDTWGRQARWATADQQKLAARLSDITDYAVLPITVIGLDWYLAWSNGDAGAVWTDLLLILETGALSAAMNQIVKFTVGRERPYAHFGTSTYEISNDANLSFYSGHSNFAFSLVVAAGTVAQLRGYKNAWLIWAVGLPLAAVVPYLRMAADKHYLTDVVTGSLAGAAFGVAVPLLHGRESQANVAVLPAPNGVAVVAVF